MLSGTLYLVCLWIMVFGLRRLPDRYAQENFAGAELLCLEKVIGGERDAETASPSMN